MRFDASYVLIFGIPAYLFFGIIGAIGSLSLFPILLLKNDEPIERYFPKMLLSLPGLFAGAKLFGMILNVSENLLKGDSITKETFLNSGIVFYGGLIGFLLTFYFICRKSDSQSKNVFDCVAIVIPLFHMFGRIGCFYAGCCYGVETDSFMSVVYSNYINGSIVTATRIPIQLIESACNLVIFAVLLILNIKQRFKGKLLFVYLFTYAVIRFHLEFMRGDWSRDIFIISLSQLTSIIIVLVLLTIMLKRGREKVGKVI